MHARWWVSWLVIAVALVCTAMAQAEEPPPPVLATAPGADTPYGSAFAPGAVHDHGPPPTNLTTPYAAERLAALIASLDAPVGGRPLGTPVYVVEAAPGHSRSVEASPRGAVLIYRSYLETLSGVKIDPARPGTVDAAVRATLNHGQRARSLQSILAHELGHHTQGHGRFGPGTEYQRRAEQQSQFLIRRMEGVLFQVKLEEAMRLYRRQPEHAGRPAPDAPSISSHVYEYLADQHAVTATYLKDGNLRGALDFWNRVSEGPGKGPGIQYSHPTRTARMLNAVSFVEANPQIFAAGLDRPLHFRVARDLPPLALTRAGDTIEVSGREAVVERLSPPEKLVYERFQGSRAAYYRKAGSPLQRLLYPEAVRPRRLEGDVADAFTGRAPPASAAASRAHASLHADLARGAILAGPALAMFTGLTGRLAAGDSIQDSVRGTARALDPGLLATDAAAGTLGAAAGSLVPIPAALTGLRLAGGIARIAPALGGAMVAARLATQALVLHRQGRLDPATLMGSIDWVTLAAQIGGSAAGLSLASAAVSAGLLPALALGPIALVPLAAAIAGSFLAERLVQWFHTPARGASVGAGPSPTSLPGSPGGPSTSTAAERRVEPDDPFADLRLSR